MRTIAALPLALLVAGCSTVDTRAVHHPATSPTAGERVLVVGVERGAENRPRSRRSRDSSRSRSLEDGRSDVVFRRPDRDAVLRRLEAWARGPLAARPEVRSAVLIGSLSRGDWSARSDADVVVIVDRAEQAWRDRSPVYGPTESVGVPVDILVYTLGEASEWSPRFRAEVERGIVLYDRDGRAHGRA